MFNTQFGKRGCKPCIEVIKINNETRPISKDITKFENKFKH